MLRRRARKLICAELTTLSTTPTQRYYVPAGTRTTISAGTATNISASAATLTVTLIPATDTFVRLIWQRTINAGATVILPSVVGHSLDPDMVLYADTNANASIHLTISGYEESEA